MENSKVKLVIGFITYGKATAKYLPYFLPSLTGQDFRDSHRFGGASKIIVFDNSNEEENENIKYLNEKFSEIEIMRDGKNLPHITAFLPEITSFFLCPFMQIA